MSSEQIKKMQQKKFLKLVSYIAQHSPYYQEVIKKNNIDIAVCKPEDFPILTKEIVIEYFDQMVTDSKITKKAITRFLTLSHNPTELFLNKYYVVHTSGSSRKIGYYAYTPEELARGIVHFTRINRPSLGQKLAYVATANERFAGATMVNSAKLIPFIYQDIRLFDIDTPFSEILTALQEFQPTSLGGYAFALRKIAEAQKAGKLLIKPRIIQSGGEPLTINNKKFIEDSLKAPIVNVYAASEHFIMGIGKDSYGGMYLMEDDLIFELHDTHTCITNLFNYTLPLIRYKMDDQLEKIQDAVQALSFTKISPVIGRKEHDPIFLNDSGEEDFISSKLLDTNIKNVASFQLHLLSKSAFVFMGCLEKGLDRKTIQKTKNGISETLQDLLQKKLMTNVTFTIEIVDHLWADPKTGKFRLIVKKY